MTFRFEKLHVYQKAIDYAERVCELTGQFASGYGFLVDQHNRAALSIAANVAEGNGILTFEDPGSGVESAFFSCVGIDSV